MVVMIFEVVHSDQTRETIKMDQTNIALSNLLMVHFIYLCHKLIFPSSRLQFDYRQLLIIINTTVGKEYP